MNSWVGLAILSLAVCADAWRLERFISPQERASTQHTIRIDLIQPGIEKLREIEADLSNPKSPNYGKWLTKDEVKALVGQPQTVHDAINNWIGQDNCNFCPMTAKIGIHGDYMWMTSCVARFECVFDVKYGYFTQNNKRLLRSREEIDAHDLTRLQVPNHLRSVIYEIIHVGDRPTELRRLDQPKNVGFKGETITPSIIRTNYDVEKYDIPDGANGPQGTQACGEFQYDYWRPQDLVNFQTHFGFKENNVTHIIGVDNYNSYDASLDEASLDFEYITTVEQFETWAFVQSGFTFDLIEYCQSVANTPNAPYVHSLSYGEEETGFGYSNCEKSSDEFMKMTAQGFTFMVASGDSGTGSRGYYCQEFDPLFPATSPYVTAVGATYLESTSSTDQCSITFSGSGFSNVFVRPTWQDSYVNKYFDTANMPPQNYYNASGRGIPDVAAYGTNYDCLIKGRYTKVSGTSASCPTVASLVTWANAQRQADGLSALGNINQKLYASGNVGTDITCGKSQDSQCSYGFDTAVGWDAATGLGTPLGPQFFDILTAQ